MKRFTTKRFSPKTVEGWIGRDEFWQANIGLCPGLNGFTVLDIDDPAHYRDCVDRFGHTPIQAVSPRGGCHLYYRSSDERCADQVSAAYDPSRAHYRQWAIKIGD